MEKQQPVPVQPYYFAEEQPDAKEPVTAAQPQATLPVDIKKRIRDALFGWTATGARPDHIEDVIRAKLPDLADCARLYILLRLAHKRKTSHLIRESIGLFMRGVAAVNSVNLIGVTKEQMQEITQFLPTFVALTNCTTPEAILNLLRAPQCKQFQLFALNKRSCRNAAELNTIQSNFLLTTLKKVFMRYASVRLNEMMQEELRRS